MGFVWLTSCSLTLASYCSYPNFSIWRTVSITAGSPLRNARRSLLSSVNGLPISSMVLARLLTSLSNAFYTCLASSWCSGSNFVLFSVDASNSPTYFSHLRPQNHPAPQSSRALSVAFCPSIIFHCSIVLLVALVNGNSGESACCLLHHEISFQKLCENFGMNVAILLRWTGIRRA